MKTPKYLLYTDHTTGFESLDEVKELIAQDAVEAMSEASEIMKRESVKNLFRAYIYERIPKTHEYKRILATDDACGYYCNGCSTVLSKDSGEWKQTW